MTMFFLVDEGRDDPKSSICRFPGVMMRTLH